MTRNSAAVTVGRNWAVDKLVSPEHVRDSATSAAYESRAFNTTTTTAAATAAAGDGNEPSTI
jgi:hypothetical protein